jgi:hypothetical protein
MHKHPDYSWIDQSSTRSLVAHLEPTLLEGFGSEKTIRLLLANSGSLESTHNQFSESNSPVNTHAFTAVIRAQGNNSGHG